MRTLWLTGLVGAALVAVPVGAARDPGQQNIGTQAIPVPGGTAAGIPAAQMVPAAADDRQAKIAKDSARLLELANELKAEVDKTNKDEMSLNVIRKAEEIEKLAHDLKQRMRS